MILCTNGTTSYYLTGLSIDGTSVTPLWLGGSAPTGASVTPASGTAVDAYSFTIIKTASATYTVLAGQIGY